MIKFSQTGKPFTGPPAAGRRMSSTARSVSPWRSRYWVTDDRHEEAANPRGRRRAPPRLVQSWHKHRGPGAVTFAGQRPTIGEGRQVNTTATFSLPGEYIIRIEGNDSSGVGGGGFQCCWTTAYVKVNVKRAPQAFTPAAASAVEPVQQRVDRLLDFRCAFSKREFSSRCQCHSAM